MKRKGADLSELLQMISPRHRFFQVCMLTRSSPQIRVVETKISSEKSHTIKCETVLVTRTLHHAFWGYTFIPCILIPSHLYIIRSLWETVPPEKHRLHCPAAPPTWATVRTRFMGGSLVLHIDGSC